MLPRPIAEPIAAKIKARCPEKVSLLVVCVIYDSVLFFEKKRKYTVRIFLVNKKKSFIMVNLTYF